MSNNEENSNSNGKKVGYGNPPPEGRFKPGKSGNPLGRPRKSEVPPDQSFVDSAYIAEARRRIRVKDQEGVRQLSTIHIAIRNQALAAVKGDLKAQKDFAANTRVAERAELLRNEKLFAAAIEYKAVCEAICEQNERYCSPAPIFDLNPDHLITDANKRTVRLSVAANNSAASTLREMAYMRRELITERETLSRLLADQTENAVLRRALDFVENLLQRLDERT